MKKSKLLLPVIVGALTVSSLATTVFAADMASTPAKNEALKQDKGNRPMIGKNEESKEFKKGNAENGKMAMDKMALKEQMSNENGEEGFRRNPKHDGMGSLNHEELEALKNMTADEREAFLAEKKAECMAQRENFNNMTDEEKEAFLAEKKAEREERQAEHQANKGDREQKQNKKPARQEQTIEQ